MFLPESMFGGKTALLLLVSLVWLPTVDPANILVVPNQSLSHVRYFTQMSEPLVARGHTMYAVMNGACSKAMSTLENAGISVLPYFLQDRSCFSEDPASEDFVKEIFSGSSSDGDKLGLIKRQAETFMENADSIFDDMYIQDLTSLDLDLAVVDGFPLTLYNYILPYKLGVPHATLTTGFMEAYMGVPGLTSFTPSILGNLPDKMNLEERIKNTATSFMAVHFLSSLPGSQDSLVVKYVPERAPVSILALQRASTLWLLNTDVVLDYPRASLPHIVHVGGLSTRPRAPLPHSLQTIMDGASNGVIILSFGSLVKNLPQEVINKVIEAFRKLDDVTIIMKYNGPPITDVPSHVHVLPWLPQNDLLAHPSVRLFITHCGNNGQFEAVYHGVPMLGMPIFGDQNYNAVRMAVKGFGIEMSITKFTSDELLTNIQELLANESYSQAIKKASRIYRSRPLVATERATYWLEHVLTFGGDHLMSHGTKLPWYQYWLVDVVCCIMFGVMLVLIGLLFLILFIIYLIRRALGMGGKVKVN